MARLHYAAADMDRLEQLAMRDSPVHRLHPMAKLFITVFYIVMVMSFNPQDLSGIMPFLFYPAVMVPLSGTPLRPLLGRLLTALPFSLMGGLSSLFLMRGPAFRLGEVTISFGMVAFASIMLKTLLAVFSLLILTATTSFIEISRQLAFIRVPRIICFQLVMTYRYLSLLLSEAGTMFMAYTLRSSNEKGIRMKHMGSFLGQLILRSFDRADRVYSAMKCRGFNGVYPGVRRGRFNVADIAFTAALSFIIVTFRFLNFSLFLGRFF